MIGITHTGKIGDLGFCLPICSWIYKTTGEKIIFILPHFPFTEEIDSLLRLQPFTADILHVEFEINNYDLGGQPYIFNPHDYIENLDISKYYNIGFRSRPDKYIPEFYAEEHGLGVDYDFVLNLGLEFRYNAEQIMCSEVMGEFFPNFRQPDFNQDFLYNLREFAYAKERHLHFSSLAVYLTFAKIPFYLYNIVKIQPFVNLIAYDKYDIVPPTDFWLYYRDGNILDVRTLDGDNKITSIYNTIFFK